MFGLSLATPALFAFPELPAKTSFEYIYCCVIFLTVHILVVVARSTRKPMLYLPFLGVYVGSSAYNRSVIREFQAYLAMGFLYVAGMHAASMFMPYKWLIVSTDTPILIKGRVTSAKWMTIELFLSIVMMLLWQVVYKAYCCMKYRSKVPRPQSQV